MSINRRVGLPVDGSLENLVFSMAGVLTVVNGVSRIPIHGGTFEVVSVAIAVNTAPTGASILVDVNKNNTTIYGTQSERPEIAASGHQDVGGTPTVTTVTTGDYLTVDIDQVGSTIAGADLVVSIRLQRTA